MDDLKFRKVCESKGAIEEILRTVLDDDSLQVLECFKQKSVDEPIFHGVILDCKCRLFTDEIVDIEVQVALDDNPLYRMQYNGSILTVENSPKKKEFRYEEIPKIILIMFCEFDYFGLNKPIYEIIRVVKGTNVEAPNGIRELYINLKANIEESKLSKLFKLMTTTREVDTKEFPRLSKKKEEVNDLYLGGDGNMSGLTREIFMDGKAEGIAEGKVAGRAEGIAEGRVAGKAEGKAEGIKETYAKIYKEGLINASDAARMLNISVDDFLKIVKEN